jgi:uncharacterized C2H2 Zn-finger protein
MRKKGFFRRPCKRCGGMFKPTGDYEIYCNKCNKNTKKKKSL